MRSGSGLIRTRARDTGGIWPAMSSRATRLIGINMPRTEGQPHVHLRNTFVLASLPLRSLIRSERSARRNFPLWMESRVNVYFFMRCDECAHWWPNGNAFEIDAQPSLIATSFEHRSPSHNTKRLLS
jgi:hypothetical protein